MTFADFTMATSALRTFSDSITNITGSLIDLGENSAYVKIYREFMKRKTQSQFRAEEETLKNCRIPDIYLNWLMSALNIPALKKMVLEGLNLQAEKGKFYVIVGKNSRQNNLVRLLCRLYDPSSGDNQIYE